MKKFIIIGPQNAITNKDTFPLFKENKIWLGTKYVKEFFQPNGEIKKFGNICWYTNIDNAKRNKPLDLYKHYSNEYKHYDNYDAIEVGKVCEIPMDYDGVMGVPVTFLDKYNPNQFEIIWQASGNTRASAPTEVLKKLGYIINKEDRGGCGVINGVRQYSRIFIRHRK